MEQREILLNRKEFLKAEELVVVKEINQSKAKNEVFEQKTNEEKNKIFVKNERKQEERYNQASKR